MQAPLARSRRPRCAGRARSQSHVSLAPSGSHGASRSHGRTAAARPTQPRVRITRGAAGGAAAKRSGGGKSLYLGQAKRLPYSRATRCPDGGTPGRAEAANARRVLPRGSRRQEARPALNPRVDRRYAWKTSPRPTPRPRAAGEAGPRRPPRLTLVSLSPSRSRLPGRRRHGRTLRLAEGPVEEPGGAPISYSPVTSVSRWISSRRHFRALPGSWKEMGRTGPTSSSSRAKSGACRRRGRPGSGSGMAAAPGAAGRASATRDQQRRASRGRGRGGAARVGGSSLGSHAGGG